MYTLYTAYTGLRFGHCEDKNSSSFCEQLMQISSAGDFLLHMLQAGESAVAAAQGIFTSLGL